MDSESDVPGDAAWCAWAKGCERLPPAIIRGRGVAPAKAVWRVPTPFEGPGVDSVSVSVMPGVSGKASLLRGCGVGNLRRGRAVELITERRKSRRRVCGVTGSSSSGRGAGVVGRSKAGPAGLKRGRGRGNAGVGVNAGEEKALDNAVGDLCRSELFCAYGVCSSDENVGSRSS